MKELAIDQNARSNNGLDAGRMVQFPKMALRVGDYGRGSQIAISRSAFSDSDSVNPPGYRMITRVTWVPSPDYPTCVSPTRRRADREAKRASGFQVDRQWVGRPCSRDNIVTRAPIAIDGSCVVDEALLRSNRTSG